MGAFGSKQWEELMDHQVATPTKETGKLVPVHVERQLDPRSPSAGIFRTPVQLGLHTEDSSQPYTLLVDPRSPTADIERTPIMVEKKAEAADLTRAEEFVSFDESPAYASCSDEVGEEASVDSAKEQPEKTSSLEEKEKQTLKKKRFASKLVGEKRTLSKDEVRRTPLSILNQNLSASPHPAFRPMSLRENGQDVSPFAPKGFTLRRRALENFTLLVDEDCEVAMNPTGDN